jgi:lysozyme family protein
VLQRVLGVAADGKVGDATLAAARARDPAAVVVAICDERLARRGYGDRFLAALPPDIPTLRSADALRAWIREMQTAPAEGSLAATQANDSPFSDSGEPDALWSDEEPPFPPPDPPFSEDF